MSATGTRPLAPLAALAFLLVACGVTDDVVPGGDGDETPDAAPEPDVPPEIDGQLVINEVMRSECFKNAPAQALGAANRNEWYLVSGGANPSPGERSAAATASANGTASTTAPTAFMSDWRRARRRTA